MILIISSFNLFPETIKTCRKATIVQPKLYKPRYIPKPVRAEDIFLNRPILVCGGNSRGEDLVAYKKLFIYFKLLKSCADIISISLKPFSINLDMDLMDLLKPRL